MAGRAAAARGPIHIPAFLLRPPTALSVRTSPPAQTTLTPWVCLTGVTPAFFAARLGVINLCHLCVALVLALCRLLRIPRPSILFPSSLRFAVC